jgi:hypothetical protein
VRRAKYLGIALVGVIVAPYLVSGAGNVLRDPTQRGSAGLAPDPATTAEPVLQVYRASVYGWRGLVADHTWISAKTSGASGYTVYQVIGWRRNRGLPVVSIEQGVPDRYWWGSEPQVIADHRGAGVDELIARVDRAARSYPHADEYVMWPGPNSNSFTAWVALEVAELQLELPWRAIGKNWMVDNYSISKSASAAQG